MIRLVVFDIDGVITDGTVIVDMNGTEQKKINLKDIDAIFELHREQFKLAAITGENTEIVHYFEKRFPWDYFYCGAKKKTEILLGYALFEIPSGETWTQVLFAGMR